ncbi:iron ABC transporter permease [Rapidithrix thailandica]|uniref:Iron ABC transporter permease n=1 Tax=Rapidithrix thailandica TaxID=413964 RepID=A0AAW9SBR4_9BACT
MNKTTLILLALSGLLGLSVLWSLSVGAVDISSGQVVSVFLQKLLDVSWMDFSDQQARVLMDIRFPRILFSVAIGGGLGISGAAMQGLFRNPLVEPGLIGVSSGAALMAVLLIVFGSLLPAEIFEQWKNNLQPLVAFVGGLITTLLVYRLSRRNGKTQVTLLILSGVAINAILGASIGLALYFADDQALRSYTFWSMGDLGGASWSKAGLSIPLVCVPALFLVFFYKPLNALALGEAEAWHLGVSVEKVKYVIIGLSALSIGASVAVAGMIGFVGLVVPHILRVTFGPNHQLILPGSMITGALLLNLADLFARTVVAPSEIPIGIVTACIGGPFFLWLLMNVNQKRLV